MVASIEKRSFDVNDWEASDKASSTGIFQILLGWFDLNNPEKGGSFYIQNKIFHAYKTLLPFSIDYNKKTNKFKKISNFIKIKSNLNNKI